MESNPLVVFQTPEPLPGPYPDQLRVITRLVFYERETVGEFSRTNRHQFTVEDVVPCEAVFREDIAILDRVRMKQRAQLLRSLTDALERGYYTADGERVYVSNIFAGG